MNSARIQGIDIFRGWAILLMIAYHFTYDLNHFNFINIQMNQDIEWKITRYTIITMFLLSVGMSLTLAHQPQIQWKKMFQRLGQISTAALIVSIATYVEFPQTWVYFGILHFVIFASIVGIFFIPYPKLSLVVALLIFIGSSTSLLSVHWLFDTVQPLFNLPKYHTEDLVIPFPWLGTVLLGITLVGLGLHKKIFAHNFFQKKSKVNRFFSLIGKHALLIYMIHQPILFGSFMLFSK